MFDIAPNTLTSRKLSPSKIVVENILVQKLSVGLGSLSGSAPANQNQTLRGPKSQLLPGGLSPSPSAGAWKQTGASGEALSFARVPLAGSVPWHIGEVPLRLRTQSTRQAHNSVADAIADCRGTSCLHGICPSSAGPHAGVGLPHRSSGTWPKRAAPWLVLYVYELVFRNGWDYSGKNNLDNRYGTAPILMMSCPMSPLCLAWCARPRKSRARHPASPRTWMSSPTGPRKRDCFPTRLPARLPARPPTLPALGLSAYCSTYLEPNY